MNQFQAESFQTKEAGAEGTPKEEFDLEEYLSNGVENIVKGAMKAAFRNPREITYLSRYALSARKAAALRKHAEGEEEHIPPFLIASITNRCNLHCAGCYARSNHACFDYNQPNQLSKEEWGNVFTEAKELGICFILLAGGEPFVRKDVLEEASLYPSILFPVFTNGTMMNEGFLELFDKNRNLVPVISIEGGRENTDVRRGSGVYDTLAEAMRAMEARGILYGASVTVTKANLKEVTGPEFVHFLSERGCKVIFYIEYVPVTKETKSLALKEAERDYLRKCLSVLRKQKEQLLFISFPGDEKSSGGCLAAGRGFFHINATGGAEPCPFSPYSDTNIRTTSLKEALSSPLFQQLRESGALLEEHAGGCVLFEKKEQVSQMLVREEKQEKIKVQAKA
ncbi:MAG: radical SAM protein [Lachnospiraceae bacterium]|nr:radical SAM protein [Lachnospiraceae bacterium]